MSGRAHASVATDSVAGIFWPFVPLGTDLISDNYAEKMEDDDTEHLAPSFRTFGRISTLPYT